MNSLYKWEGGSFRDNSAFFFCLATTLLNNVTEAIQAARAVKTHTDNKRFAAKTPCQQTDFINPVQRLFALVLLHKL